MTRVEVNEPDLEPLQVCRGVHIDENVGVEVDDARVQLLQRIAQRERARSETAFEHRQRGAAIRTGQRSRRRDRGIGTARGKLEEMFGT